MWGSGTTELMRGKGAGGGGGALGTSKWTVCGTGEYSVNVGHWDYRIN